MGPRNVPVIIDFLNIAEAHRGNTIIIEDFPFEIRRIFYFHGVHPTMKRGGHAHKTCEQILIAINGSFVIILSDLKGENQKTYFLSNPAEGLYLPTGYYIDMEYFSPDAVCLVLASEEYDPNDYVYKN